MTCSKRNIGMGLDRNETNDTSCWWKTIILYFLKSRIGHWYGIGTRTHVALFDLPPRRAGARGARRGATSLTHDGRHGHGPPMQLASHMGESWQCRMSSDETDFGCETRSSRCVTVLIHEMSLLYRLDWCVLRAISYFLAAECTPWLKSYNYCFGTMSFGTITIDLHLQ